ncbi:MAG: hypothetical protein ACYTKD_20480 [Planctomycetota bacterium]|jgi:hypothetical protein
MAEPRPNVGDEAQADVELTKLRLDYAWKWFEFHARQRITMFSFFLVTGGILANAYVAAAANGPWYSASAVGIVGALASVAFVFLDCRNRWLVGLAEDVLADTERSALFAESIVELKHGNGQPVGILKRDEAEKEATSWHRRILFRHKWWIRFMELAVGIAFAAAAMVAWARIDDRSATGHAVTHTQGAGMEGSEDIRKRPEGLSVEGK